jgi:MYXO-CTERM domain-containing protein
VSGDGCGGDGDCETAYCDMTTGAGVCMVPCNPMVTLGQCQFGESCQPLRSSGCGVCLCGPGILGDFCASDLDCLFGLCRDGLDGVPRCTTECDGGRCPAGATCQSVEGYDGLPEQRCVATGQRAGGGCASSDDCQSGNCFTYSGSTFCTRPCGGICDCPRGLTCVTVGTGEGWCVPDALAGSDGCGCRAAGAAPAGGLLALLGLASLLVLCLRRRRA